MSTAVSRAHTLRAVGWKEVIRAVAHTLVADSVSAAQGPGFVDRAHLEVTCLAHPAGEADALELAVTIAPTRPVGAAVGTLGLVAVVTLPPLPTAARKLRLGGVVAAAVPRASNARAG